MKGLRISLNLYREPRFIFSLISKLSTDVKSSPKLDDSPKSDNVNVRQTIIKVVPVATKRLDYDQRYTANNYLTLLRAVYEYMLKPSDLEGLKQYTRRSPYSFSDSDETKYISVYSRAEVEKRALEVWGSMSALEKARNRRRESLHDDYVYMSNLKKSLRDYQKKLFAFETNPAYKSVPAFKRFSPAVLYAAAINGMNALLKGGGFLITGSASMFSEMIHSIADTVNQLILAYGQWKAMESPDSYHPYGYTNMTYITSLISGVGIFCFGTGLALYHGALSLLGSCQPECLSYGLMLLLVSLVSESGTLFIAVKENLKSARSMKMTFFEYVRLGYSPSVNVVLLEDAAAVCGVLVAGASMICSHLTGSHIPDGVGSLIIGGILGYVAFFIISSNSTALTNRSIHPKQLEAISTELENDICVRALFDVKATDMGTHMVMFKAEVDLDGSAVTRSYLENVDMEALLNDMKSVKNLDDVETFMIKHGEGIIDRVGAEIDRLERKIRKKHPDLRHVDLEVL